MNTCIDNTLKRIISRKDQFITLSIFTPITNFIRIGCSKIITVFSRMNMHHRSISNVLHELRAQLLSENQSRSNHNHSLVTQSKLTNGVIDSNNAFTSASWSNNDTLEITKHCFKSVFLVRAKLEHGTHCR
jgi:hypothetical protein